MAVSPRSSSRVLILARHVVQQLTAPTWKASVLCREHLILWTLFALAQRQVAWPPTGPHIHLTFQRSGSKGMEKKNLKKRTAHILTAGVKRLVLQVLHHCRNPRPTFDRFAFGFHRRCETSNTHMADQWRKSKGHGCPQTISDW